MTHPGGTSQVFEADVEAEDLQLSSHRLRLAHLGEPGDLALTGSPRSRLSWTGISPLNTLQGAAGAVVGQPLQQCFGGRRDAVQSPGEDDLPVQVVTLHVAGANGSVVATRVLVASVTVPTHKLIYAYAYGLRRREISMLDVHDVTRNPPSSGGSRFRDLRSKTRPRKGFHWRRPPEAKPSRPLRSSRRLAAASL